MKTPYALLLTALLLASPASAQSGGEMLHACELLQSGMHKEGESIYLPPGADVNQCWGFMSAVAEYAGLADRDGKPLLNACAGPDLARRAAATKRRRSAALRYLRCPYGPKRQRPS